MSTINVFQISLEIWGCLICVILTMITGEKVYKEGGALARIWFMLLANGLLLACDSFAYIFRGDMSTMGTYMTRISNFMVFALEGIMTWNVVVCVQCLTHEYEEMMLKDRWIRVCGILVLVQLVGIAVTPFTGFYYYFDNTNHYHRASGVFVSFLTLGIVCFISAARLFLHRRKVPQKILHAFKVAVPVFCYVFLLSLCPTDFRY